MFKSRLKEYINFEAFKVGIYPISRCSEPSKMRFSYGMGAIFEHFGVMRCELPKKQPSLDFGGHLGRVLAGFVRFLGSEMIPEKRVEKITKNSHARATSRGSAPFN